MQQDAKMAPRLLQFRLFCWNRIKQIVLTLSNCFYDVITSSGAVEQWLELRDGVITIQNAIGYEYDHYKDALLRLLLRIHHESIRFFCLKHNTV